MEILQKNTFYLSLATATPPQQVRTRGSRPGSRSYALGTDAR